MIAVAFLIWLETYFFCGLLFALPFAFIGAKRIDPHAARGTWGFRLLIISGAAALWPILLARWAIGGGHPPEESNAHRVTAKEGDPLLSDSKLP